MSLICVCVKKASIAGDGSQLNTYVCLKLQNVKSTTIAVKGCVPSWEQDFMFEAHTLNTGLTAELWNKGVFWDRMLGCAWIPLGEVSESAKEGLGRWVNMDSEYRCHCGNPRPTDHRLLLDIRMEHGYGADQHQMQLRLSRLKASRDEECMSEDSDYTSDYNLPMHHQHNLPAFQYRSELMLRQQGLPPAAAPRLPLCGQWKIRSRCLIIVGPLACLASTPLEARVRSSSSSSSSSSSNSIIIISSRQQQQYSMYRGGAAMEPG
uniref:C2 domain-containing protein n=1 Tax=Macrostomum lignano TaxID=282301 RepID=A0A1I8GNF5_9PLAT